MHKLAQCFRFIPDWHIGLYTCNAQTQVQRSSGFSWQSQLYTDQRSQNERTCTVFPIRAWLTRVQHSSRFCSSPNYTQLKVLKRAQTCTVFPIHTRPTHRPIYMQCTDPGLTLFPFFCSSPNYTLVQPFCSVSYSCLTDTYMHRTDPGSMLFPLCRSPPIIHLFNPFCSVSYSCLTDTYMHRTDPGSMLVPLCRSPPTIHLFNFPIAHYLHNHSHCSGQWMVQRVYESDSKSEW